jgi:hypothetical protein
MRGKLKILYLLYASIIKEVAFGGSGIIKGVAFGGSGIIRGMTFGGSGIIRRVAFGGSDESNFATLYYRSNTGKIGII